MTRDRWISRKALKRFFVITTIIYAALWLPWLIISIITHDSIRYSVDSIPQSEVGVVFGGLYYENQQLTETNQERLLAAKLLLEEKKIDKIVLSNTEKAALAMKGFLVNLGVPESELLVDTNAVVTLDTCRALSEYRVSSDVIFISHSYHIPRLIYQCEKEGVEGIGLAPDKLQLIQRSDISLPIKMQVRFLRYQREAFFTFLSILGIYKGSG